MAGNIDGTTDFTGVRVGGGGSYVAGSPLYAIKSSVVTVVATTVTATKSVDTTAALTGFAVGDSIIATPATSGLSAGVTLDAWVSAADVLTIRYSNVSTANAAQIATAINVVSLKVVA